MRILTRSILFGFVISTVKFCLWAFAIEPWNIELVSISGLVAGIFFILATIFRSALQDYKEADKHICQIRAKICSMNDLNRNAALTGTQKYDPKKLGKYLIETLKIIKKYLKNEQNFENLQNQINEIVDQSAPIDAVIPANKVSRFQQYHDHLRGHVSYLEYGKSLQFPRVGYIFLYFFIFSVLFLQIFSTAENILLETVFIFSLSSVFLFFAELARDLDRPFERKKAAFVVDLSPLDAGIRSIEQSFTK